MRENNNFTKLSLFTIGVLLLSLMQYERNIKLRLLIRGYNWKIKTKIALVTKSDTYFGTNNFCKCDIYFGTEGVLFILI